MRNALAHVPKGQHTVVAVAICQAFTQPDRDSAGQTWRHVADQKHYQAAEKAQTAKNDAETIKELDAATHALA